MHTYFLKRNLDWGVPGSIWSLQLRTRKTLIKYNLAYYQKSPSWVCQGRSEGSPGLAAVGVSCTREWAKVAVYMAASPRLAPNHYGVVQKGHGSIGGCGPLTRPQTSHSTVRPHVDRPQITPPPLVCAEQLWHHPNPAPFDHTPCDCSLRKILFIFVFIIF